jgi:hypothetical protein
MIGDKKVKVKKKMRFPMPGGERSELQQRHWKPPGMQKNGFLLLCSAMENHL